MSTQFLLFNIEGQRYGIPISSIREINRITEITKIPESPSFVAGVMNLRGKVIPVVSLRLRMKLSESAITRETCTIVVDTIKGQIGIIVDSVSSVLSVNDDDIDQPHAEQRLTTYIKGIGKIETGLIMIIDIEKCLNETDESQSQSSALVA